MSTVSTGLFNLFKHNYETFPVTGGQPIGELLKQRTGWGVVNDYLDACREQASHLDFWLVGSHVYLSGLDIEEESTNWSILYDGHAGVLASPKGWQVVGERYGQPIYRQMVDDEWVHMTLIDSQQLPGADDYEDTHPVVSFLSKAPISTWCVAVNWYTREHLLLPAFTRAKEASSIDVANQGSFLAYISSPSNRQAFQEEVVSISKCTGLMPDGDVLALLDMSPEMFVSALRTEPIARV